jgi:hypothetical protein
MQEGKVARWADAAIDHMLAGTFGYNTTTTTPASGSTPVSTTTTFQKYTWAEFWSLADDVFNPPNVQANAALKLDKLRQEKLSAEEFFIEFDLLAATAGYDNTTFDSVKIRLANQRLNNALVANIHNVDVLPTTWEAYKKRAIALDNNW